MRKKLFEAGVEIKGQAGDDQMALRKKIQTMRERGSSYQAIADSFNLWKISTRKREGKWHAKTVRDISLQL